MLPIMKCSFPIGSVDSAREMHVSRFTAAFVNFGSLVNITKANYEWVAQTVTTSEQKPHCLLDTLTVAIY